MATRLSAEERRASIVAAALPVIAEHGINGVTTRQIAEAAGVSEALLYKHFPSKEALYSELHTFCVHATTNSDIGALPENTSTLVLLLYWSFRWVLIGGGLGPEFNRSLRRLMLSSGLEDGDFAHKFLNSKTRPLLEKMAACAKAAQASGDLRADPPSLTELWFAQCIAFGAALLTQPEDAIIEEFSADQERLVEASVRFALRGLGVSEAAIAAHFNPEAFRLLAP